ncbi:MAG: HIG1 domain-containing protein [Aquincola sp.]|nr:HIG1 domain-containing protein [Aquincola sp.]MDH5330641.1 HIG1 domain-containing protein [Aquincola sp.]
MNFITVILVVALIATVFSLIGGLSSMVAHGETGHHTSEQWMIMRVASQALAVAMILLLVFAQ